MNRKQKKASIIFIDDSIVEKKKGYDVFSLRFAGYCLCIFSKRKAKYTHQQVI